jgi:hypothetical protein
MAQGRIGIKIVWISSRSRHGQVAAIDAKSSIKNTENKQTHDVRIPTTPTQQQ